MLNLAMVKHVNCEQCHSKHSGIFCELSSAASAEVGQHKIMHTFKKGHDLFIQGSEATGLYCVQSGKIKISKSNAEGHSSIVRIAGPGDVLGHRSLFMNENYSATATTLEETTLCFIDKKFIFEVIKKEPTIALHLIQQLSRDMGTAETKTASLSQKTVKQRLAELILGLKNSYGVIEGKRTKLDIKLTREEMASLIGSTVETTIRFMSELKMEGWIEQEGKTIYITDEAALLECASLND